MMNKDNLWLQRDGSSGRRVFFGVVAKGRFFCNQKPAPTGRRRLFSPLHATKAGIHSRYQSKSRMFPPHTTTHNGDSYCECGE